MELSAATWPTLSKLLDEALDLEPAARAAWLDELTATQPQFAPSLRRLLAAHASSETADVMARLPPLSVRLQAARTAALSPGDRVGPYRLKRELGAGGMADVWLAERADGAFARDVALKLPLISRLRRDLAQRFARERDILARLEHPHIARLYDAGVSDDGLPYLAMEYVDGQPIVEYCDGKRLDVAARLRLFLQVLEAVQYAHANLIIHRDLKPSNILVTSDGQVRLLDFGIAKLLAENDTAHETQLTHMAGRALTPDYASPEQVKGEPLTIATDIYSLAVVLYELLAGSRPYRLKVRSAAHLEQAIVETEPKRPSSSIDAASASARATYSSRLTRTLSGDLDTIVLKSLAKAPDRRYATVAGLAADLQRHLDGHPVSARPAAWTYRVRKFVARNKVVVGATTAAMLALVIGAGIAGWQAHAARIDQRRAEQVKAFLASIFVDLNPAYGQGSRVPASAILLKASNRIDSEFGADPRIALEVATLVAKGLVATDERKAGGELIKAALHRYGSFLAPSDPHVLSAQVAELRAHAKEGTFSLMAESVLDLIAKLRATDPPLTEELVFALQFLAAAEVYAGRRQSAETLVAEAATIATSRLGEHHQVTVSALYDWSNTLLGTGNLIEAGNVAKRGLTAARAVYERPHPSLSDIQKILASVLMRTDMPRDAAALLKEVLEDQKAVHGDGTVGVAHAEYVLGQALVYGGQLAEGVRHLQSGQQALQRLNLLDHRNNWIRRNNLALSLLVARLPEEAMQVLDEADRLARASGVKVAEYQLPRIYRGMALTRLGRFSEATAEYDALASIEAQLSPTERAKKSRGLALLARLEGRANDAVSLGNSALATVENSSMSIAERAVTRAEIGLALLETGNLVEAEAALKTSRAEFSKAQVESSPDVLDVEVGLARIALLQGKKAEAVALLDEALKYWHDTNPDALDAAAVSYWRSRANGSAPSAATMSAIRGSPYPLHRKWLATSAMH